MIDPWAIPLWTRVATSTATQVFTGECELVRLVLPIGRATTDTVTVYDGTTAVGTFGAFTYKTGGTATPPVNVEIGVVLTTGIRIKCATLAPVVVVYRGRAA